MWHFCLFEIHQSYGKLLYIFGLLLLELQESWFWKLPCHTFFLLLFRYWKAMLLLHVGGEKGGIPRHVNQNSSPDLRKIKMLHELTAHSVHLKRSYSQQQTYHKCCCLHVIEGTSIKHFGFTELWESLCITRVNTLGSNTGMYFHIGVPKEAYTHVVDWIGVDRFCGRKWNLYPSNGLKLRC